MYKTIMVPVDLAHLPQIATAIDTAGDLARHYGAKLVFVSITPEAPGAIARNPQEFATRLAGFAAQEGTRLGVNTDSHAIAAHDPTIDTDKNLLAAITQTGADLVVMATHRPGLSDYFWSGHGANIAAHAPVSVFLVR